MLGCLLKCTKMSILGIIHKLRHTNLGFFWLHCPPLSHTHALWLYHKKTNPPPTYLGNIIEECFLRLHFSTEPKFIRVLDCFNSQYVVEWNVTPLIFEGGGSYYFAAYFAPLMQLLPSFFLLSCTFCLLACLLARACEGSNKGRKFSRKIKLL